MTPLNYQYKTILTPKAPFNFDGSVFNPSHFPAPTEIFENGKFWQTTRFDSNILGFKMENKGAIEKPKVRLTIYSKKPLTKNFAERFIKEIKYRFELDLNLSEFNQRFKVDLVLGPVIKRWRGMRSKCGYSLYESLMIYIVLQNATVRRTVQMINAFLEKYGDKVSFDVKTLYAFWKPEELQQASEEELKSLKVGYRAKFFKKISESFAEGGFNEMALRKLNSEELRKKLLSLYGIGPHSVGNLLWEVFHNHETLDIMPPWEQKIYSRLLYNKVLVPAEKILEDMGKRWGKWKRMAAFYIWTDLFWRHQKKPISWLAKEIRF